jgi:hypothetical protein
MSPLREMVYIFLLSLLLCGASRVFGQPGRPDSDLYFESVDGQPPTARYGQPDLKAARAMAEKAQAIEASREEEREKTPQVESPGSNRMLVAGSAIDTGLFRYARSIIAGEPELSVLPLDAAVLAHSRIADLRIAGADEKQVPYLVEKADEPLSLDLPPLEKIKAPVSKSFDKLNGTGMRSYYRLRLPYSNLPDARLVLTTSARVFRRYLTILIQEGPHDERWEPWTYAITEATWAHTEPETASPSLTLKIPLLNTAEAMVVVEEGNNRPLPITSVKMLLPQYRLRFFRGSEGDLMLYYGRSDLRAPRYDLAILAPRLLEAAAQEVRLGPEIEVAAKNTSRMSLRLFWGILIGAVLILLILIVRLVKKS